MVFAVGLGTGSGQAEALKDVGSFEVDPLDGVIGAATFDGRPVHDGGGGGATRVAEIGLLVGFVGAGAGPAVGQELSGGKPGALGAINNVNETEFDGVGHFLFMEKPKEFNEALAEFLKKQGVLK